MLAFLAARAVPATEQIAGDSYRRSIRLPLPCGEAIGTIAVTDEPDRQALRVDLSPGLANADAAALACVRIGRMFDVACDPLAVASALHDLGDFEVGLRLPGSIDAFEIAVRAVLGQQVTVAAARTLATRLVARFGVALPTVAEPVTAGPTHLFPTAARLAVADASSLGEIGIIRTRGQAIIALAQALSSGELRLSPDDAVEPALAALLAIRGIGPWTAHYIAMRTLGWTDAFPPGDVVVLKAMQTTKVAAAAVAQRWQPWRAYAVLHLWRRMAVNGS